MRFIPRFRPGLLSTRFFAIMALCVLAVSFFGARSAGALAVDDAAERLRETALRACEGLENHLDLHRRAIQTLALLVQPPAGGDIDMGKARRILDSARQTYPGFVSLRIVDQRAPEPYISGAFLDRGLSRDPLVAIGVPCFDAKGRFRGVIEGLVKIGGAAFGPDRPSSGSLVVAQDGDGRVVYSSRADLHRPLETWEPYPIDGPAASSLFLLADPALRDGDGAPIPLLSVRFAVPAAGWQVVAAIPADDLSAAAYRGYGHAVALLALVMLLTWALARLFAGGPAPAKL